MIVGSWEEAIIRPVSTSLELKDPACRRAICVRSAGVELSRGTKVGRTGKEAGGGAGDVMGFGDTGCAKL